MRSPCRSAALATCVLALPAAGQEATVRTPPAQERPVAGTDDIVVQGYRERKSPETRAVVPTTVNVLSSRRQYEFSERMANCAVRGFASLARLRAVVDGLVNSATARLAQDRIVRLNVTCDVSASLLSFEDLGSRNYVSNRGALTIAVLKRYASDLTLTRDQMDDPAVQRRLYRREVPRNRLRLQADHQYLRTALCVVRTEPALAVRLALSDGPARLGDLQEALIDRARACLGNPRRVVVDPTQFRLFVADAVYRWAVAVRDTDSLIPAMMAGATPPSSQP